MMESDVVAALVVAGVFMVVSMFLVCVFEWLSAVADGYRERREWAEFQAERFNSTDGGKSNA